MSLLCGLVHFGRLSHSGSELKSIPPFFLTVFFGFKMRQEAGDSSSVCFKIMNVNVWLCQRGDGHMVRRD